MKKWMLMVCTMAAFFLLGACGGEDGGQSQGTTAEIGGETYDAGNFSVLVPDGWLPIVVNDMWAEDPSSADPDQLKICKDAQSEMDLYTKPSVHIVYYDPGVDMMRPSPELYDEAAELDPITAGDRTWEGMTAVSQGAPLAILWTGESGADQFQVTVWLQVEEETISLDDAAVQAILSSIQPAA